MTTSPVSPTPTVFIGIDIAATTFTFVVSVPGSPNARPATLPQTPEGFHALQHRLLTTGFPADTMLVVMEATGSYWIALATALYQAGFAVSVLNPAMLHNYAKSLPRRGKSDPRDAAIIAQFGQERRPTCWSPPPAVYHELRQRLMARDALVEMRKQAKNQRHALLQWPVVVDAARQHLDDIIAMLDTQLRTLEDEIVLVLQEGAWAESALLLQSIPGIGSLTTGWLLVTTINFTLCPSAEAMTAYAGLAPLPHESGASVRNRQRIGSGGNRRLRSALYLATMSAAQHNPVIKGFYERLWAAGKPSKVARCAAARKLLLVAWAVVTKRHPFDAHYARTGTDARATRRNCQLALA